MEKCCCFTLKTGSILIALLEIILGAIGISLILVSVSIKASLDEVTDERPTVDNLDIKWLFNPEDVEESITHLVREPVWGINNIIAVVRCAVLAIFGFILLIGIKKNFASLLKFWIIATIIGLAYLIVHFILRVLIWEAPIVSAVMIFAIEVVLQIFFLKVVYDYRKQSMVIRRRQGEIQIQELKPMTVIQS